MGATLNNKPSLVRLGAFAAVLLLTAGLLVTLFQEAQGSEWQVDNIGTVSGTATITAEIVVPAGDALPITSISGVIENNEAGLTSKQGHIDVGDPIEIATCETPTEDCASGDLERTPSGNNVFSAIRFEGAFRADNGAEITDAFFHTDGGYGYTFAGAYGVHDNAGFGYGGEHPGGPQSTSFGYGYGASDLVLEYEFDVQTGSLGSGDYWFTAVADTGSGVIAGLQSAAKSFTVRSGSAGPGSGTDGGGGGGGGDAPTSTVDASELTNIPEGALEGWRGVVTGKSGDKIQINTGSDSVPRVDFTLSGDADGADVDVVVFPADSPPEGTPAATWRGAFIVQITISTGGEDHQVEIFVEIDADDMEEGDEDNAFGAKHVNPWVPQSKVDLTLDGSKYAGSFSASCCSVFMVGFDGEDPTITLSADDTSVEKGDMVTFTADADDDVQVDRVEFYLGDQLMHTANSEPYSWEWTTADASVATHNVRAVAYDIVGNEAEDSQSVEVQQMEDDDDGGTTGGGGIQIGTILLILAILAVVAIAVVYFMNQKKK